LPWRGHEKIMVPAKFVVTFKSGLEMEERVKVSNDGQ
jgi:nucleoid DNA-binding protein